MSTLDWIATIILAVAMFFLVFSLLFLLLFFKARVEKQKLSKLRIKNKKKRKYMLRARRTAHLNMKKNVLVFLVFLTMGLVAGSGAGYIRNYQATNLSESDQKAIVSGYYYLRESEKQLTAVVLSGPTNESVANLNTLSSRLSAFALNKADDRINNEGQQIINRYYTSMKELGINLSSHGEKIYEADEGLAEFKDDIEKVKKYEKAVFKQFKVDEKALTQKKSD